MTSHRFLTPILPLLLLAACSGQAPTPAEPTSAAADTPPPPVVVGADRDARGCIPSGGYRWCKRRQRCERPWELAAEQGVTNTPEAFADLCGGGAPVSVAPAPALPDPAADETAVGVAPPATAPDARPLPAASSAAAEESPLVDAPPIIAPRH